MDIENVIEQFDVYINAQTGLINILGEEYNASEVLKDINHTYYRKKLDEFIHNHFSTYKYKNETIYEYID